MWESRLVGRRRLGRETCGGRCMRFVVQEAMRVLAVCLRRIGRDVMGEGEIAYRLMS